MAGITNLISYTPRAVQICLARVYAFIRRAVGSFVAVRRARHAYGDGYLRLASRLGRLSRRYGFSPQEAFALGLLAPDSEVGGKTGFVPKSQFITLQRSINPVGWDDLTEDKGIFHRFCVAFGLDVPVLYAIIFRNRSGWTFDGRPLRSRSDWAEFLETQCPSEFVVKPSRGAYGRGVESIERYGTEFVLVSTGERLASGELLDRLFAKHRDLAVVVQEKLEPHPELMHASGSRAAQTIRMMTIIDRHGTARLLGASFKIIVGDGVTDSFNPGLTNNLITRIDVSSGRIEEVIMVNESTPGYGRIDSHPTTGSRLVGMELPYWESATELALEAARAFFPIRTVGWDIAITPTGPRLIEGNVWWDPPNLTHSTPLIAEYMQDAA